MPTQAARFYRLLLKVYPVRHQREYAELMVQVFGDLYRQTTYKHPTLWDWLAFWTHIVSDTMVAATIEHYHTAKERIMSKNLPPIALQFLPLIAIFGMTLLINQNIDLTAVYISILVGSCIGWALSKMGIIPDNALWTGYAKGIFIGLLSLVLLIGMSSTVAIERQPSWIILPIAVGVYAVVLFLTHRFVYRLDRILWKVSLLLPVVVLAAVDLSLPYTTNQLELNQTYRILALAFALIQLLTVMVIPLLTLRQTKEQPNPILLMVGGSMIYAVFDPGYFTGETYPWINLTITLFPLLITPFWWLYAKTENGRVWGTFGLWVAMFTISETLSTVARTNLGASPNNISRIFIVVIPLIVMMWIVLQRTSNPDKRENRPVYSTSKPTLRRTPPSVDIIKVG